ncbi:MAG: GyrI-like domain-containing protein [Pseudolabrys sp.]|jgi:effector-binding domain-containing protein
MTRAQRLRLGLTALVTAALVTCVALPPGALAQGSTDAPKTAPEQSGPKPAPPMPEIKSAPSMPAAPLPGDAFGEEVTLPDRNIIFLKGHTNWDTAFDTLIDAFKSLNEYLAKANIKPAGPYLTIYTETDDTGFSFQASVTIAQPLAAPPKGDIAQGKAPSGKALKFVHRGSYDAMDSTYEAITNYLDDRQLEAQDLFIEEYTTDPIKSDPNNLVVNVYVPVK